jgi:TP901 family phage tail tape measure protein
MSDSDFAMSIVDKFNEVSNNFAISSGGIGEALQRSASSLAAANNTLDESIALITAANTVVQNPEKVGNAFKTISMRIRGAKTELEEMGEDTSGMAESTASLREEIMALSGVDIMEND